VSVKKSRAKGKSKRTTKKNAGKSTSRTKKPKDIVEVRENINSLVRASAKDIANKVIEVAKETGQLASAKYLFEAVGLYPATEQTAVRPQDNSLALTLLKRMGLPTEPAICEEDPAPIVLTSKAKDPARETVDIAEEDPGSERKGQKEAGPAEGEE
jgi:hypothetical protein